VRIYSSGEKPQDVLQAYADAAYECDIVVGPLSRDDVAAVAQSDRISKPTIALAQPDWSGDGEIVLPQKMLMMGLSLEDEARQIANWADSGKKTSQAWIVSTDASWQRRTAAAFADEWKKRGRTQQTIELPDVEGYLAASSLVQLKERIQAEKPVLVFLALDAQQAFEVRKVVGNEVPMYGTSQINGIPLADRQSAEPTSKVDEMNGVRLVDIPWQLQADDLAVMSYPPLPLNQNQTRRADLERLYALGIDAYRVAREIAMHEPKFALDGVTGALTVSFGNGMPSFKRVEQQAIYKQGNLVPLTPSK
jgi:outer membrane PBP1 activator LpoA protein